MTTENIIETQKFVLNKEELIKYHNRLIEHPDVKLLERAIEGQRMLEEAAQVRKLLEDNEQTEEQQDNKDGDGVEDGEKRLNDL